MRVGEQSARQRVGGPARLCADGARGSDLRQPAARHPERSSDREAVGRDCVVPSRRRRRIAAGNSVAADRRDVLPTPGFRTLAARLVIGLEADRGQL